MPEGKSLTEAVTVGRRRGRVRKLDPLTPCVACPQPVRDVYEAVMGLLEVLDLTDGTLPAPVRQKGLRLAVTIGALADHVDAHVLNQKHAWSPELARARFPELPTVWEELGVVDNQKAARGE